MKLFLKKAGSYTAKKQAKLAQQATDSAGRLARIPYTWQFTYEPGPDINSYSTIFTACGIQYLFEMLGISEITPAMCTYDYDMAELGGSIFRDRIRWQAVVPIVTVIIVNENEAAFP